MERQIIAIDEIIVDENLYPRKGGFNQDTVNQYRESLDQLPPIEITPTKKLVDGFHRITAYRIEGRKEIPFVIVDIPDDQVLWEAIKRNAIHGLQLSASDKKRLGIQFFDGGNGKSLEEISGAFRVDLTAVRKWTQEIRQRLEKEQKEQENTTIWDLYLKCFTETEIAKQIGLAQNTVSKRIKVITDEKLLSKDSPTSLQLFNVWNFQNNDAQYGTGV